MSNDLQNRRPPTLTEVSNLFYYVGEAIWFLQHLEVSLSYSIAIKHDFRDAMLGSVDATIANETLSKRRRLTLGQAVEFAKKNGIYGKEVFDRLSGLLEERNWLVHRLVYQSANLMNIDGERENLLERIALLKRTSIDLNKAIVNDIEAFVVSKGGDIEKLNAQAVSNFLKDKGFNA